MDIRHDGICNVGICSFAALAVVNLRSPCVLWTLIPTSLFNGIHISSRYGHPRRSLAECESFAYSTWLNLECQTCPIGYQGSWVGDASARLGVFSGHTCTNCTFCWPIGMSCDYWCAWKNARRRDGSIVVHVSAGVMMKIRKMKKWAEIQRWVFSKATRGTHNGKQPVRFQGPEGYSEIVRLKETWWQWCTVRTFTSYLQCSAKSGLDYSLLIKTNSSTKLDITVGIDCIDL